MKNKYEKWTTEKLNKELELIYKVLSDRNKIEKVKEAKQRCINGITAKDFVVYWGNRGQSDSHGKPHYTFCFCIKHGDKVYDIYYECESDDGYLYSWWPFVGEAGEDDNWERNGAYEFIPPSFGEACENCYEYSGTFKQAIKQLKLYGFEDIQRSSHDILDETLEEMVKEETKDI